MQMMQQMLILRSEGMFFTAEGSKWELLRSSARWLGVLTKFCKGVEQLWSKLKPMAYDQALTETR